jgi:hypothetical protein
VKAQLDPVRVARGDPKHPTLEARRTVWARDGLAVTESIDSDSRWIVTHVASGYAVLRGFRIQRDAIAAAEGLLPLGDWTVARSHLSNAIKHNTLAIRADLRNNGTIS